MYILPLVPLRDRLPTRLVPFVTYLLIAANVCGFILERSALSQGWQTKELLDVWGLVPARFFVDPVAGIETVFTSMFMHDPTSLGHIGFNMLFLWIFGDNVEDALGHARYLAFYVGCGLFAAAAQTLVAPTSVIPMVGASGAIAGVLAAYALLYPRSPIDMVNPIILLWPFWGFWLHFPAWLVIGEWFVVQLMSVLGSQAQGGGVAFMAHLGGFLAGAVLLRVFMAGRERLDEYARWQKWARRRPRDGGAAW